MVTQIKEEYLAAGIRDQIELLQSLSKEIQFDKLPAEALNWRIKAVELGLRKLRQAA